MKYETEIHLLVSAVASKALCSALTAHSCMLLLLKPVPFSPHTSAFSLAPWMETSPAQPPEHPTFILITSTEQVRIN